MALHHPAPRDSTRGVDVERTGEAAHPRHVPAIGADGRLAVIRHGVALLRRVSPPPRVHLTRCAIAVPGLAPYLDGLRVLHLSDLHLHGRSALAEQVPTLVAGLPHDLVVYTGDYIETDEDIPRLATFLARMPRAPAYAVLGNHDYRPFGRPGGAQRRAAVAGGLECRGRPGAGQHGAGGPWRPARHRRRRRPCHRPRRCRARPAPRAGDRLQSPAGAQPRRGAASRRPAAPPHPGRTYARPP